MGKNSIAFLDTNNTVNEDGRIEVGVYRHTYEQVFRLPFNSPAQSKRAVVKILMDRATLAKQIWNILGISRIFLEYF